MIDEAVQERQSLQETIADLMYNTLAIAVMSYRWTRYYTGWALANLRDLPKLGYAYSLWASYYAKKAWYEFDLFTQRIIASLYAIPQLACQLNPPSDWRKYFTALWTQRRLRQRS